jgi:hypothetical protein
MIVRRNIFEQYNRYQFSIPLDEKDRVMVKKEQQIKKGDNLYIVKKKNIKQSIYIPSEINCDVSKIIPYISCIDGEYIEKGDVLAKKTVSSGLFINKVIAPTSGMVDLARIKTGFLDILSEENEVLVKSQFEGNVLEVNPVEGIKIETTAYAFDLLSISKPMEGLRGKRKYYTGEFVVLGQDDEILYAGEEQDYQNKIVFVGKYLHPNLLKDLYEKGANFVLTCTMDYTDFREGKLPVGVINGFGNIHSSDALIKLLYKYDGSYIVIDLEETQAFLVTDKSVNFSRKDMFVRNLIGSKVLSKSTANYGMLGVISQVQDGGEYVTVDWEKGNNTVVNIALLEFISL